ncbi:hypothetical protein [Jannaschia sp. LMIT008]|uniref:hypothetical protein n=1 Tax=Jannaschia maritima TaxID=3032585 RepID=UPI0028127232|nr:hypothetical protein [Jannaschia sp. LMIT008]
MSGPTTIVTLRERLRLDTRRSHDAMDRAYRRFDTGTSDGLAGFLQGHLAGLTALADNADRELVAMLAPMLDVLRSDLAELDADAAVVPPMTPKHDNPLARRYLWLAVRLGTRMQARHLRAALDPRVQAACRFVDAMADPGPSRAFVDILEERSARGLEAEGVLRAANDWFACYEHCAVTRAAAPGRVAATG